MSDAYRHVPYSDAIDAETGSVEWICVCVCVCVCITEVDLNVNREETNNMYMFHHSECNTKL